MKLNQQAFEEAQSLIQAGKVDRDSDWSEVQPSPDDENAFLKDAPWQDYSNWFLGINEEHDSDSKGHYGFPYGDFEKVHRSGLIAAKQRAAQYKYADIEEAVNDLLVQIDKEPDIVNEASDESFPASDAPNWRGRR